jgi:DNA-binding response OmpR family regulator
MKPCMLIVDDDLNVVKQLKWTFHDQFIVIHALTLDEISDAMATHHPIAALIDMHLPPTLQSAETGIDLVRILRSTHPDLLLIGISVNQDPDIPVTLKDAGASFFLQKPFTGESLKMLMNLVA